MLTFVPSSAFGALGVTLFHIRGTVTDRAGRPLEGVVVDDGHQLVTTNSAGAYDLPEENTGTYTLRADRRDTEGATKGVSAEVPADKVVDFSLRYLIGGSIDRRWVSPDQDSTAIVSIESPAPMPGSPGGQAGSSCVTLTSPFSGATTSATPTGAVGPIWGGAMWSASLLIPAGTPDDLYWAPFIAKDCATGADLSLSTDVGILVDGAAPHVGAIGPRWARTADPIVVATVDDRGANYPSGINPSSVTLLIDGAAVPATYSPDTGRVSAQAAALQSGPHSIEVRAADRAGNSTVATGQLDVDMARPSLTSPGPSGVMNDPSPRLSVQAADIGSGLNPASVTMTLTDGLMSCGLPAALDSSTGRIAYEVPATFDAVCPGRGPLHDGNYQATVFVSDRAGNTVSLTWAFDVKAGPTGLVKGVTG